MAVLLLWPAASLAQTVPLRATTEDGTAVGLPLEEEWLRVSIDRQHASGVLRQIYRNESGARLEGQFVFRGGQEMRVSGFSYFNGETKIVGEVYEREVARQIYDRTVGRRRDPGLAEKTGEGSFSFSVFPIEPGERKRVEVAFDQWLVRRGSWVELRLPLARADADVRIDIDDERTLGRIESPSHRFQVERVGPSRVRLRVEPTDRAEELVVRYELLDAPWSIAAAVHRDASHDAYLVLSVAAPRGSSSVHVDRDVTLVIDRSGSMAGEPLRQAKRAATEILTRLSATDRFNLLWFDDEVAGVHARPVAASDDAKSRALTRLDLVMDGGGTNIAAALREGLARQHDDHRSKVMLLLTDGESNAQAALKAQASDRDVRVFTIGLGPSVDRALLSRLARVSGGAFVYVDSASALPERVSDLYRKLQAPVLTELSLDVQGATLYRSYPARLPDLYPDDELRVVGRLRGDGMVKATLRGTSAAGPVTTSTRVALPKKVRRAWVGKLWAEARVGHLLEEIAMEGETTELREESIELALSYDLATPYTSFLAIPATELTSETASALSSARERKRRALARHSDAIALRDDDEDAAGAGLDSLCALDPDNCVQVRMDEWSSRDVDAEMYAVQRRGGCGGCAAGSSDVRPAWAAVALLLMAFAGRCRSRASRLRRRGDSRAGPGA